MTIENNTINLTPEQAKERLKASEFTIKAMLEGVPQPYALGISGELKKISPELPSRHIARVMGWITNSPKYLDAAIKAGRRTALDGSTSELLEEHKQHAAERLKKKLKHQQKIAKEKKANPVVTYPTKPQAVEKRQPVTPVITIKRRKVLSLPKRESAA